jgi:hypothetical protein
MWWEFLPTVRRQESIADKWKVKSMSEEKLLEWIAGWKPTSEQHIAGMHELRRRDQLSVNVQSWIAIAIAAISLLVSIVALFRS